MKKALCIFLVCAAFGAYSQKPRKADAKDIVSKTLSALKAKDSLAFKLLFLADTSGSSENTLDFISPLIFKCYHELQFHLREVFSRNVPVNSVRIEKLKAGTDGDKKKASEYEISAIFMLGEKSFRSFTFPCAYYRKSLLYVAPCSYGSSRN